MFYPSINYRNEQETRDFISTSFKHFAYLFKLVKILETKAEKIFSHLVDLCRGEQ